MAEPHASDPSNHESEPQAAAPTQTPPTSDSEQRNWMMFCHLAALSLLVGLPFGHILGPLIVWLIKRDTMPAVDSHGKESLNFQITMSIVLAIGVAISVVLMVLSVIPIVGCVTMVLLIIVMMGGLAVLIIDVVFVIQASMAASRGEFFVYPFTWRVIQ